MRFALVGGHPDGRAFAEAAVAAGHELAVCCDTQFPNVRTTGDVEELLADPGIDAVIVAVEISRRLDIARRVLQSERSAAVVHPVDVKPDGAYELAMLAGDTHQVLLPLLTDAVIDLPTLPEGGWVELLVSDPVNPLLYADETGRYAAFPGWSLFRRLLGEIVEVNGWAFAEKIDPTQPISIDGRGASATFRARYQRAAGPAQYQLSIATEQGATPHNPIDRSTAWPRLVEELVRAVSAMRSQPRAEPAAGTTPAADAKLSWRDAVRAAELDEAAARSIHKRRAVLLEYQEASEEVGFKGTMTLIGCGMLWMVILLLILSAWQPWLGWLILPAILLFLGLQVLGTVARSR
jgi:hypothetical protein